MATRDAGRSTKAGAAFEPRTFAGGRFVARQLLGEGGQKTVYLAHDTQLDRDVAIAVLKSQGLDEAGIARVRREAQTLARLGAPPHIVTIFDFGAEPDRDGQLTPYVVCEYMPGGDLERALRQAGGPLPLERVLAIGQDVCRALVLAHEREILHRDIKPGNIWFTADGTAKLGDFGLAMALGQSRLTEAGTVLGTAFYMPPEQVLGSDVSVRSDLYSLGCVVYEMVTGRPPFVGDDTIAVVSQHINTAPVAPSWHRPDVPRALDALLKRLLAKAPEDRPESATVTLEALAAIAAAPESGAAPVAGVANPLDRLAGGVFVGREEEAQQLRAALDAALSGQGALLLLAGEPGIGKTRLAEELTTYARLRGAQVLWGRCYEGEGAPAYWPWVQAIRAYVHEREPEALRSELGTGAADIAQVVSEVRERLPDVPAPSSLEPEQARFRLFDAITTFLKNASRGQPLLLVLDDLHWADKSSLLLLEFLARGLAGARLLVLATYRDVDLRRQHPLSATLAELTREQLSQRLVLGGLSEEDVSRFIEITSGAAPPEGLVSAIYKDTEGNPFFVKEVVNLLVREGRLDKKEPTTSWTVAIPQSVREVVQRRLDHLSGPCNNALTIAAVIGREFYSNTLEALTGSTTDELLDILDEAVAGRVVAEVPSAIGRYAFAHGLVRETLYEEIAATRRARLHGQVGEAIERAYSQQIESHLAELAHHFYQAARAGQNVEKAVEYAARAGERAIRQFAYEQAATHYEAGLHVIEHQAPPDENRRAELLIALGDAHWRAGDRAAAREALGKAAEVARQAGSPEQSARALLRFEETSALSGRVDKPLISLIEQALAALGPEDSTLRATLMAHLARALSPGTEERGRFRPLAAEAVEMARRAGDERALADALLIKHDVFTGPDDLEERLATSMELTDLASKFEDPETTLQAYARRTVGFVHAGDLAAADHEFEAGVALARKVSQPLFLWLETMYRAMRATLEGRFDEAEQIAQQALALGQRVEGQGAAQVFAAQLFAVRWGQGRLGELEAVFRGFAEQYPPHSPYRAATALLYCELERRNDAAAEFERFAADGFSGLPLDGQWLMGVSLLALVCTYLEDRPRAAALYGLLAPYAGRNIVAAEAAVCNGSTSRFLGLLAATLQNWEQAEQHFEQALEENANLGGRALVAHTQREFAGMLRARGGAGDEERALALLRESASTAEELGMLALMEKLRS